MYIIRVAMSLADMSYFRGFTLPHAISWERGWMTFITPNKDLALLVKAKAMRLENKHGCKS